MKKNKFLILVYITISMMLVGCGKINLTTITEINKDGSGYVMGKMKYDNISGKVLNPILEKNIRGEEEGFKIKKYKEDNMEVIEYKYSLYDFKTVSKEDLTKYISIHKSIKPGVLKNKVYLDIKVNKDILKEIISHATDKQYKVITPSLINFIKDINYENQMKVPGKIVESNAMTIDNDVAKWNYKLNEIKSGTTMSIVYVQNQFLYVILLYVFVLGVLMALVCYKFIRKHNQQRIY